jgi:hypothetical protein
MWLYAGLPPPVNISRNEVVGKRIEGGLRGISHRDVQLWKHSPAPNYSVEIPQFKKIAKEAIAQLRSDLSNSGIDYVRCWFQWNFFQPRMDSPEFQFPLDNFVAALGAEGVEIVAVLACGYSRFLPLGINEDNPISYLAAMEAMSRAVVSHYGKSIRVWQIENEPNWWFAHSASGWRHGSIWQAEGFQDDVLQTLKRVVREESPGSLIAINLEADRKRTSWESYSKYCDVLGLDFYPNYMKSLPIDVSTFELATEIRELTDIPLFIAETGYPSGPTYEGFNDQNQAVYAQVAAEKAYSLDALNGISLWRYSDSDWQSFPKQENFFGLKRQDRTPKPSWAAYLSVVADMNARRTTERQASRKKEASVSH